MAAKIHHGSETETAYSWDSHLWLLQHTVCLLPFDWSNCFINSVSFSTVWTLTFDPCWFKCTGGNRKLLALVCMTLLLTRPFLLPIRGGCIHQLWVAWTHNLLKANQHTRSMGWNIRLEWMETIRPMVSEQQRKKQYISILMIRHFSI